ncbi:hypothetical protein D4764_12G0011760 [Takifugu flavidus]|uniref:Uncharacterized protein n=1 Tax=Takifugu flavidus TaxID=433684 RepID=A0A5C6PFD8_9TELE|nr:hypothetical protein D4764_12G0011760 [Takifugu flavidus]
MAAYPVSENVARNKITRPRKDAKTVPALAVRPGGFRACLGVLGCAGGSGSTRGLLGCPQPPVPCVCWDALALLYTVLLLKLLPSLILNLLTEFVWREQPRRRARGAEGHAPLLLLSKVSSGREGGRRRNLSRPVPSPARAQHEPSSPLDDGSFPTSEGGGRSAEPRDDPEQGGLEVQKDPAGDTEVTEEQSPTRSPTRAPPEPPLTPLGGGFRPGYD